MTTTKITDIYNNSWRSFPSCLNYHRSLNLQTFFHSLKIESGAFADCTSLTSIAITNNVTSIGNNAFNGCSKLTSTTYKGIKYTNETGLTNALTSNGVSVGSNAFTNTKLQ